MSDPIHGHYRTKEEVEEQKKSDPILTFGHELLEANILSQTVIDEMELEIKKTVEDAVEFAEHSPEPPPDFLFENVYS
jgi:pyruvate dehydrogenase E1 component alpha subunit